MKKLVINADDFGFTHDVNAGIVEAHRHGILTATTIMANGAAFEDAVRLARENPELDIGCHLVLVQGRSVLSHGAALPETLSQLVRAVALGRIRPYEELAAQVRVIVASGLRPTHLDTHKHTHLLPSVLEAVARLSEEFGIPWVRRPFDYGSTSLVGRALRLMGGSFRRVLARHGCRTTDSFAGFQMTGRFGPAELAALIRKLPAGVTEFMCHPGRCGDELRSAATRLKESRERELAALTHPDTRRALAEAGVELVSYRSL
ncbi:MAG TPA: ChbG/HpnK family deacetylase [Bryobacteraceae bacterium]|nr:ChbG/HpnK family deacetylase [Bryobacteraceae bacterium]